jgi:phospholipid transport system substrate-binding protein
MYWKIEGRNMFLRSCLAMFLSLASVFGGYPNAAHAADAKAAVKSVLDKAMDIQTRPELQGEVHIKERERLIRQLISESFGAEEMARESLKENWDKLSPGQRTEFQKIFAGLFQDSYTRMVLNFLQQENVEYRQEAPENKGMKVSTTIMRANEHIPVDYHLTTKGGRWVITDVDIDGVSIVDNYRSTFRRVIQTSSFDNLLQKMRLQSQAVQDGNGESGKR